jgi:molybdopterin molybdotransferase
VTVAPAAGLLSLEAAREAILAAVPGPLPSEVVALDRALGRVLAEPVVAAVTLPPWDNSAMDGYAVRASDLEAATEASPVRLAVVGDIPAGASPGRQGPPGTATRIATGAPIPVGSDAVVQVEVTSPLDAEGRPGERGRDAAGAVPPAILVHEAPRRGANIRLRGSDLGAGDEIVAAGTGVSPAVVALAAGAGLEQLSLRSRPRVAVLATGNEVRAPGDELGEAGIPDANGPGLRALVRAAGGEPTDLGIAADQLVSVLPRLRSALASGVDAVIVSGGVSVGPYDVVKLAFEAVGEVSLWRVAVQPGKPFAFGVAGRRGDGSRALLFGLPGNPVSTFVTFELFVRPALRALAGRRDLLRPVDRGVLLDDASSSAGRRTFLRVTAERNPSGAPMRDANGRALVRLARGAAGQASHVLSVLAAAEALAVVPEAIERHRAGDPVELWWLDSA